MNASTLLNLLKRLEKMQKRDVFYLLSGHSQHEYTKQIIVPAGVVYTPIAFCSQLLSKQNNLKLMPNLKSVNGVRALLGRQKKIYKEGDKVNDVLVTTTQIGNNDTGFHGMISLPINEKHNLTNRKSMNRFLFSNMSFRLGDIFDFAHEKWKKNPNNTYYVIGNYCQGLKTVKTVKNNNGTVTVSVKNLHNIKVNETKLLNAIEKYKAYIKTLKNNAEDPNYKPGQPNLKPNLSRARYMKRVISNLNRFLSN